MNIPWALPIDLGILSVALLVATCLRARVGLLQRFLIPNALVAGFILLPIYNLAPALPGIDSTRLGELTYHLLGIVFATLALRPPASAGARVAARSRRSAALAITILSQYVLQGIVGVCLAMLLMASIMPQLFPAFGLLLPLGFALGPGQAYAIGESWRAVGIEGAGSIGLTFAALGYLFACFGGVTLIHIARRKRRIDLRTGDVRMRRALARGLYAPDDHRPSGARLTTAGEAIESLTFHMALILGVYLLCFLLLRALTGALVQLGPAGLRLANNLWGIHFIFASLTGLAVRHGLRVLGLTHLFDVPTFTRISGLAVDYMTCAAIAAISFVVVWTYWLPIVIIAAAGSVTALVAIPRLTRLLFRDHYFPRLLIVYGVSTGTLATGLALLRMIDPHFDTPVVEEFNYAAGLTFLLAIPFILAFDLPLRDSVKNVVSVLLSDMMYPPFCTVLCFSILSIKVPVHLSTLCFHGSHEGIVRTVLRGYRIVDTHN